jgi:hypothetical protein
MDSVQLPVYDMFIDEVANLGCSSIGTSHSVIMYEMVLIRLSVDNA